MKKKILIAVAVLVSIVGGGVVVTLSKRAKNADADEWTMGYNSAIRQFAPEEKIGKMTIIYVKNPGRKEAYTSGELEDSPYADGYHKALEILTRESTCPRN